MSDQLVKMLNSYGYQPVFLPKTGLVPPELYNFDAHKLIRLGPLESCIKDSVKFQPTEGKLGSISGQVTSGKNIKAAVGFLNKALSLLGISNLPSFDISVAGTHDFVFSFADVTYKSVDPIQLDSILQGLTLPLAIPTAYVASDAMHIAYEYAYSSTLMMSRADGNQFSGDMKLAFQDVINLNPQLSLDVKNKTTVTFQTTGNILPAFAYKAGQLKKEGTHWTFKPEIVVKGFAGVAASQPYLPAYRVVLEVEEEKKAVAAGR